MARDMRIARSDRKTGPDPRAMIVRPVLPPARIRRLWSDSSSTSFAPVLCNICRRVLPRHRETKGQDDMFDAELMESFDGFKDQIRTRVEECDAADPKCICSTPEHQTFATDNAPGNLKCKDKHSFESVSSLHAQVCDSYSALFPLPGSYAAQCWL